MWTVFGDGGSDGKGFVAPKTSKNKANLCKQLLPSMRRKYVKSRHAGLSSKFGISHVAATEFGLHRSNKSQKEKYPYHVFQKVSNTKRETEREKSSQLSNDCMEACCNFSAPPVDTSRIP